MIKQIMAGLGKITLKVTVQLIVLVIGAIITAYYRDAIYNYLKGLFSTLSSASIPLWVTFAVIVFIVILLIIGLYLNKLRTHSNPYTSWVRRREGDEIESRVDLFGVKWLVYTPQPIFTRDEYIWLDGPYCPDCLMDLEWVKNGIILKNYYGYCPRCDKYFDRPATSKDKTLVNAKKICHADLFRKNKFSD